ncbi:DUF4407 domain-containing protein [Actinoplanes sp. NPDC048967]|uniref:DUF4407 domain-containing protein n=1 Tax=Actinoplanes sp. NPDC048967 TaxID=3155269 RepID=UPI0033FC1A78
MNSPLIWLSGADPEILRSCPYGERVKYLGLGGAVLTTSMLGALSCGFALHMAMRLPLVVCVVLALAWGVAIMNLDRWLISGTQRRATIGQNLMLAAPRVLLGVLIGLVVSTPLTLRIFQDEINAELQVMQREAQDTFARKLATDERFARIPQLTESVAAMQADLDKGGDVSGNPAVAKARADYAAADQAYQKAVDQVICENDGKCGTGKAGQGKSYQLKKANRDRLKRERAAQAEVVAQAEAAARGTRTGSLGQVRTDLEATRAELARSIEARDAAQAEFAASERNNEGLLARMTAMSRLTDANATLGTAHLVLILFLTAFEVLPVLFKILLSIGSPSVYDRLRERKDEAFHDVAADDLQGGQDLALYENQARRTAETASIDAFVQEIVDVQREVAQTVLQEWRHQQLKAAHQNPMQFVMPADDDDTLVLGAGQSGPFVNPAPAPAPRSPNGYSVPTIP